MLGVSVIRHITLKMKQLKRGVIYIKNLLPSFFIIFNSFPILIFPSLSNSLFLSISFYSLPSLSFLNPLIFLFQSFPILCFFYLSFLSFCSFLFLAFPFSCLLLLFIFHTFFISFVVYPFFSFPSSFPYLKLTFRDSMRFDNTQGAVRQPSSVPSLTGTKEKVYLLE